MRLIVNDAESTLLELAHEAEEIRVMSAFLTESGLAWIPPNKFCKASFIVGVNLGITSPEALKLLERSGANVRIFFEHGRLFHPKAIYIKSENTEHLLIGSHNLTDSGLNSNIELSILSSRDDSNDEVFLDFLAIWDDLQYHPKTFQPDEQFYSEYRQSDIISQFSSYTDSPVLSSVKRESTPRILNNLGDISSLSEYLRTLSREFPLIDRRRGNTVKDHPLRILNNEKFQPILTSIVSKLSGGRLKARSLLTVGGGWYRIPNIFIFHPSREPWENVDHRGRLLIQVHFSEDYSKVYFSLVLQFNLPPNNHSGDLPENVHDRYLLIYDYIGMRPKREDRNTPAFKHWEYRNKETNEVLWSKIILSYEYLLSTLPPDEDLLKDLYELIITLDATLPIL